MKRATSQSLRKPVLKRRRSAVVLSSVVLMRPARVRGERSFFSV